MKGGSSTKMEKFKYFSYIHLYNMQKVMHFPQLDTILLVEKSIRDNNGEYKKKALWEELPKKMMYQTFCLIIDYLVYSHKIMIDNEGYIVWIHNPKLVKEYLKKPELFLD